MDESAQYEEFGTQRKLIAHMTSESWAEVPHVSYAYEPDITDFYAAHQELAGTSKITFNTIMVKVVAEGLRNAPDLNARLEYDAETKDGRIIKYRDVNVSIPWQMPNGTMIPLTIYKVNELSLTEISEYVSHLRTKVENTDIDEVIRILAGVAGSPPARRDNNGLTKEDVTGATVTVSNIGSLYKEQRGSFTMLEIIPPQVFAVGIGAIQETPGVYTDEDGTKQIGIRKILPMCLVFDHRAVDFDALIPFLKKLDEIFASPGTVRMALTTNSTDLGTVRMAFAANLTIPQN